MALSGSNPETQNTNLEDRVEKQRADAIGAGLRYLMDHQPGILRKCLRGAFIYLAPDGSRITDEETLRRIKSLAIPPAWTDVWICPTPNGHLQATGRDARGRKQYRYHPRWREARDLVKYDRMILFGEVLPKLRKRVRKDLERPGLPREKVLGAIVRLLEETRARIGNKEYRRENRSFGLTTLRDRHATIRGTSLRLEFRGKSGKLFDVQFSDRRVARVVRACQDIPGQELFQYYDEYGSRHSIDSADVNSYIRELSGHDFTAKDFRTWAGTVFAAKFLRTCEQCSDERQARVEVAQAIREVAQQLGNTPAVCRKSYVHPAVLDAYLSGTLGTIKGPEDRSVSGLDALSVDEQFVLDLLRTVAKAAEVRSSECLRSRRLEEGRPAT